VDKWVGKFQLGNDIVAHALGGSGGQRHDWHIGKPLAQLAQLALFWAKVVPPFRDAVGFVDRDRGHIHLRHPTR